MKETLVVTPTYARPKALARLTELLKRQTFTNFDWLIVCDDWEGYKFPKGAKVIKRESAQDKLPGLCANVLEALKHAEGYQKICFLEDDDYYHERYLSQLTDLLDQGEIAGFHEDAYYYVLSRRAKRVHNIGNASLAATGVRASVLPWLRECAERGHVFIDYLLWKGYVTEQNVQGPNGPIRQEVTHAYPGSKVLADNFTGLVWGSGAVPKLLNGYIKDEYPRHVGMKESWHEGARGLSKVGHTPEGAFDVDGSCLTRWIGEDDAAYYLKFTAAPKPGTVPFMFMPMGPVERF